MVAFLLATLDTLEGGKVTEEQRRWWRLAARSERLQLTSQDQIILQHGRDIIQCYWAHGLQPGLPMKLAATFMTGREREEVRARAELYYRASLDTIAVLERGETTRQPSVPLWAPAHTKLTAAQMKEMKELASQVLGAKEAQEPMETNTTTNTPVSTTTTQSKVAEACTEHREQRYR